MYNKKNILKDWFQEATKFDAGKIRDTINEPLPVYLKQLWFCLGGTPIICFGIQVVTGLLLLFYYIPYQQVAYESVRFISEDVRFGWLIRGVHHASAQVMIASIILHIARVFFTRSFCKPREATWMFGVALLGISMALGFTGYSLICDQLSYWATVVGTNIAGSTPIIGDYLLLFLRGGEEITQHTLTRFFVLHIAILPLILVSALGVHLFFIRMHGVQDDSNIFQQKEKKTYSLFPDHIVNEVCIFLVLILSFIIFSYFFPPKLGLPFNPNVTPEHIKPEWYFYGVFRYLKLVPFQVGILGSIFFGICLFFWPFIDHGFCRIFKPTTNVVVNYSIGTLFILVWAIFTILETLS